MAKPKHSLTHEQQLRKHELNQGLQISRNQEGKTKITPVNKNNSIKNKIDLALKHFLPLLIIRNENQFMTH
jgi:hypothetical protein